RGTSWIGVGSHPGPVSLPPWLFPSAAIFVNVTEPKFVSGTVRQKPATVHSDGASAIHSAEVRSGDAICRCLVKNVCRVRFFTCTVTSVPFTSTVDVSLSPAKIFSFSVTDVAGTSSYHA